MKKMTPEHKQQLIRAAWDTWSVIGSDALSCCAEVGERLTKAGACEFILDADRIEMYGKFNPFALGYSWDQCVRVLMKEDFL